MAQKIVTFEVAKVLKEAGYPQELPCALTRPTYIDAWLWLWREKKKWIDVSFSLDEDNWTFMQNPSPCDCGLYPDPEEAIAKAIDYLVQNNLIK